MRNQMTKLIHKYSNGNIAVSGRDLYKFLGIKTPFTTWIRRMIRDYGFIKNSDYVVSSKNGRNLLGGRPRKNVIFRLDTAKEICMVQKNKRGREARRYFISVQEAYQKRTVIPRNPENQLNNLINASIQDLDKRTTKNTNQIHKLNKNMPLNHTEKYRLRNIEHHRVIDSLGGYRSNAYNLYKGKAFRQGWHDFKDHFQLSRYDDLPNAEFDAGVVFLKSWHLHGELLEDVDTANSQMELGL